MKNNLDYRTKPISCGEIRQIAKNTRKLFGIQEDGPFPILEVLDRIPDYLPMCNYLIVEDGDLPRHVMAQCIPNIHHGYTIEIKESIYKDAYDEDNGAALGFICHELCHIILLLHGYSTIYSCTKDAIDFPAYESMEWQAKTLCGELMIPYDKSIGLAVPEIVEKYGVSWSFANYRSNI